MPWEEDDKDRESRKQTDNEKQVERERERGHRKVEMMRQ